MASDADVPRRGDATRGGSGEQSFPWIDHARGTARERLMVDLGTRYHSAFAMPDAVSNAIR